MCGVEARIVDDDGQCAAQRRRGGGRDRGARAVDHRVLLPRPRRRRSSTTAGCAPATSAASTAQGYITMTDRAKDVIKSGGEWISSVELENHLIAHPAVLEAAVVGVPDERWQERPLAASSCKEGGDVTPQELRDFLARQGGSLVAAGAVDVHRRGPADQRRQVRQEDHPLTPRRQRLRGGHPLALGKSSAFGALVGGDDGRAAQPDVVLQRSGDVVDLTLVGGAAQLPGQLGALREARRPADGPWRSARPTG